MASASGFDLNDLSTFIKKVDGGRFIDFAKPLHKMSVQDLEFVDEDDFLDFFADEDRPLALVLYRKHVKPLKKSLIPSSLGRPWWFDPNVSMRINLRGQVLSSANTTVPKGNCFQVEQLAKLLPKDPLPIGFIDLGKNGLISDDLSFVMDLVVKVVTPRAGIVIDLSENKLGDGDAHAMSELCTLEKVAFVNVCGNPLATEAGQAFFDALDDRMLAKVVFVPISWLSKGQWRQRIPDEDRQRIVMQTHESYFLV